MSSAVDKMKMQNLFATFYYHYSDSQNHLYHPDDMFV